MSNREVAIPGMFTVLTTEVHKQKSQDGTFYHATGMFNSYEEAEKFVKENEPWVGRLHLDCQIIRFTGVEEEVKERAL
jgi:hypothetical protein